MTAIPKYLARGLDVRLEQHVTHVRRQGDGWMVVLQNGATLQAGAVLLTPPVPQALALLEAGEVALEPAKRAQLEDIDYEPCLAVMAVLDGPTRLPPPGWLAPEDEPIAWLADNQQKGISTVPAVTIHATPAFSRAVWHQDRQASGEALLQAAQDWLGAAVTDFQVHGWRYSKPLAIEKSACLVLNDSPPLLLAGDAFGGGRVEGAALSGWAAAELLEQEV
jgi:predicted NAD/FAD-dependent oxidoreductase